MKIIPRKSLKAAKAVLLKHGFNLPDAVIEEMVADASDRPTVEYEIGDFVMIYEGMGEMNYGTVTKCLGDDVWTSYVVKPYGSYLGYEHLSVTVSNNDMRGLATVEEAEEYIRLRSAV